MLGGALFDTVSAQPNEPLPTQLATATMNRMAHLTENTHPPASNSIALRQTPYWWDAAPLAGTNAVPLPLRTEVLVVGSGYTGLSAALTLARGGLKVLVVDRQRIGEGASSRNFGLMSGSLKIPFAALVEKAGLPTALAFYGESTRARDYLRQLINDENIGCDLRQNGRYTAAVSPDHYEAIAKNAELTAKHLGLNSYSVSTAEQDREVASDYYQGGVVDGDIWSFHPGKYHAGLMSSAQTEGVSIHAHTQVQSLRNVPEGFEVLTSRGVVLARQVIIATNGYTSGELHWWQRRVVPVPGQILSTEPIGDNLMRRLSPNGRAFIESTHLFHYMRPSPDGTRLLFGGRYGGSPKKVAAGKIAIKRYFDKIFPELKSVEITHSWDGFTGFTRDFRPHMGVHDGVHYAMGFCGSGTVWGTWLGHKIALKILGSDEADSAFDRALPSIPFYRGTPWFLPPAMGWFALKDRFGL